MNKEMRKAARGRPQAFSPEEALDHAVRLFWQYGYEGVDVSRIARAVNVTKPAIYREFGDKPTLLLKAVERYAKTYGVPMMQNFLNEPDIHKAVIAFCKATVETATLDPRMGCMMASAASGQSERVHEIRMFVAEGLTAGASVLAHRFGAEMEAGNLPKTTPALVRGRMLIDLMQGLLLRARTGVPRTVLLADALSYVAVVLA